MNPGTSLDRNHPGQQITEPPITLEPDPSRGYSGYANFMPEEPSLHKYIMALRKRLWAIVAVVIIVMTLAAIHSFRTTPLYSGVSRISISRESADPLGFKNGGGDAGFDDWDTSIMLDTQVNIINSDIIAMQVIKNLRLDENPAFAGPSAASAKSGTVSQVKAADERREAGLLGAFHGALTVRVVPRTRILQIEFLSSDPRLAAEVANSVATTYIEHNFKTRFQSTMQTSDWLAKQLADMQMRVETAQEKLVKYQKDNGIVGIDDKQNIVTEKLDLLNKELASAEADRIQKEATYELIRSGDTTVGSKADGDSLMEKLRAKKTDLNSQLAQLSAQFGPAYPKVIEVRNQLQDIDKSIASETQHLAAKYKGEFESAKKRQDLLRSAFEQQKSEANKLNERAIEFTLLKRDVETSRQLYEGLLQKLKEAGVSAGLKSSNIQIVDSARVPLAPTTPNIPRNLELAFALGLVGGIALAFLLEALDNTIRSADDAQILTGLPALGIIPLHVRWNRQQRSKKLLTAGETGGKLELITVSKPNSDIAESYKALRTSIMLSALSSPPQLILITSPLPREGKTATSVNTAIVLAQKGGRVLLVDTDLRRPSVHKALGIANDTGLSTILTGSSVFESTIQRAPQHPNLDVLTAGPLPPHPAELLGSGVMSERLQQWRQFYDFIILDSPPTLSVTDAVLLSVKVDAVLLVIRCSQTTKNALRRTRNLLAQVNARVMGVVINAVDMQSPDNYQHYYYGSKYSSGYYTEEATRKK